MLLIIDEPTEFKANRDPSALEIVLSTRGAVIAGHVVNERGEPARGARVLLFPVDPSRWNWSEPTSATVSADGTFKVGPRRAGEYFLVALESSAPLVDPRDRDQFTRLAQVAGRITLGTEEERAIELRAVRIR
jgi:hypothetical protein